MVGPFHRRKFLSASLAVGAAGLATPRIAFAQAPVSKNILLVMLRGAADGLSMLAPIGDPDFARLRGGILSDYEQAQRANSFFAIHTAFKSVGELYSAKEALFVHAAATSYRDRSHFDGQNLLETGAASANARRDGWLNRLVGLMPGGAPRALAIAPSVPLALRGDQPVSSYAPSALPSASADFIDRVSKLYASDEQLGGLWSAALETQAMAGDDNLRNLRDAERTGELAASLMREADGARIGMIEWDGWDTHANQRGAFNRQATALDTFLGSYRAGMGAAWSKTLVLVVTEFGRTVRFNGTNGSDHGTASAALLLGGPVKGGQVLADWPGLREQDLYQERDLRPTIPLEAVLAGAIAEHFTLDPTVTLNTLFPERQMAAMSNLVRA
jgi:uncharacterized protein (DUF1501 family)